MDTVLIFCSWPDVPLNRNDSELELFTKYLNIIDKNKVEKQMLNILYNNGDIKNNIEADNLRKVGNTFYADSNYNEALKFYNMSMSQAIPDSIEFGLAVANRSAVLFDMEKYKDCLEDINTTFKSAYPEHLQYKIYMRQCQCYLKLNLKSEVSKIIQKVQECANKLNLYNSQRSSINSKIMEIKNQLKQQLETKASDDEPCDYVFTEPTLQGVENPKFVNAVKTVDFRYAKTLGRHVVANTEIKKGDILFVEEPYAFIASNRKNDMVHFNICAFCFERAFHCIPCLTCSAFFYCSIKCRQTAWDLSHRWECLGLRCKIITDVDIQLCLSILFQASRDGFQSVVEDDTGYGNKENNYPFVNKLLTHKNDLLSSFFKIYIKASVWLVFYLKNFTDYFDWLHLQPNCPEGSQEEIHKFVGGHLLKYLLQICCNSVTIQDGIVCYDQENCFDIFNVPVGNAIYVSTALLNHSCLPNAVQSFLGAKRVIKATQDIKNGTEITINYLKYTVYEIKRNKSELLRDKSELLRYSFTCTCSACTDPNFMKLLQPFLCPQCSGKAFQIQGEMFAKCSECQYIFDATQYSENHKIIKKLNMFASLFNDQIMLNEAYKLMKKTFHRDNIAYLTYYTSMSRPDRYEKIGDLKKSIDINQSFVKISKNNWGEASEIYLIALLNLSYLLAKYCKELRKKNSTNYMNLYDETKAVIKRATDTMQYFCCNANIKNYVADITKYLNSDDVYVNTINYF